MIQAGGCAVSLRTLLSWFESGSLRSVARRSEILCGKLIAASGYALYSRDHHRQWLGLMAEDYPRTLLDLEQRFWTEAACAQYLAGRRWPDGFRGPGCAGTQAWRTARGLWICRACAGHTSVPAGTIFADSHLPLRLWFRAIWQVVTQKDGASALGLQRVLGLGSYRTAWSRLHKLRRALVRPGRERLRGIVEVDERSLGAPDPGKSGRQPGHKTWIVAAVECVGARPQRPPPPAASARGQRRATRSVHRRCRRTGGHGAHG